MTPRITSALPNPRTHLPGLQRTLPPISTSSRSDTPCTPSAASCEIGRTCNFLPSSARWTAQDGTPEAAPERGYRCAIPSVEGRKNSFSPTDNAQALVPAPRRCKMLPDFGDEFILAQNLILPGIVYRKTCRCPIPEDRGRPKPRLRAAIEELAQVPPGHRPECRKRAW